MPIKALAHPIWQSAEEALGVPLFGKISVEPGATMIAFSRFLAAMGVIFAVTAVRSTGNARNAFNPGWPVSQR